jgi:hypothetical protein
MAPSPPKPIFDTLKRTTPEKVRKHLHATKHDPAYQWNQLRKHSSLLVKCLVEDYFLQDLLPRLTVTLQCSRGLRSFSYEYKLTEPIGSPPFIAWLTTRSKSRNLRKWWRKYLSQKDAPYYVVLGSNEIGTPKVSVRLVGYGDSSSGVNLSDVVIDGAEVPGPIMEREGARRIGIDWRMTFNKLFAEGSSSDGN